MSNNEATAVTKDYGVIKAFIGGIVLLACLLGVFYVWNSMNTNRVNAFREIAQQGSVVCNDIAREEGYNFYKLTFVQKKNNWRIETTCNLSNRNIAHINHSQRSIDITERVSTKTDKSGEIQRSKNRLKNS